jgi:hypothetical protein
MRIFLKLNAVHLIIGLIVFVMSLLAFWVLARSRDVDVPIITKEGAVQVAVDYLANNNITVDSTTADVIFFEGNWHVMFFINPSARPGAILIRINPITGKSKRVLLK